VIRKAVQPYWVDDIVWSSWKHEVGYNPKVVLTTLLEHKRSEMNSKLWNSGNEADKEIARARKRRLHYVSNIYVIKDSGNPENEGKVFLFKYGKKIWDKLNDIMFPQFADEKPIDPFNFWEGANFRLKIRKFEGYTNYDKSEFDSPSPLFEDDDEIAKVYEQQHSLKELLDPKYFKPYEELQVKLNRVLGITDSPKSKSIEDEDDSLDISKSLPSSNAKSSKVSEPEDDDTDEDLRFFKSLAKN
jgi:hypothetical protein